MKLILESLTANSLAKLGRIANTISLVMSLRAKKLVPLGELRLSLGIY